MKLLSLVRRRTQDTNHYNLTKAGWTSLARLVRTDEWKLYKSIAQAHIELMGERLLNADPDRMLEARGEIKGFREAITFVDDLLAQKENSDARRNAELARERKHRELVERAGAFSPFYGGPALTK